MDLLNEAPLVYDYCWRALRKAVHQKQHPWRTPALGTTREQVAHLRTVVLRAADPTARILTCFTDSRSAKMRDLTATGLLSWLFYDPRRQCQLRAVGRILPVEEAVRRGIWRQLPLVARAPYAAASPPGSPLAEPGDGLSADFQDLSPDRTDAYFPHFAVLRTVLLSMEWLQLHRDGHRRLRFSEEVDGHWRGQWLVP